MSRFVSRPPAWALACALVGALGGLGLFGCASRPEGQPDPFDSSRLVIQMGGMRMVEGHPAVTIALKNKTAETLWVAAYFDVPEDGEGCERFERIEPAASQTFVCVQPDLIFDEVYVVRFEAFADEQRLELLEAQSTELWFGSDFRELLKLVGRAQAAEEAP